MDTIVFTICSNNYLAHAATLMSSWFEHVPNSKGYVFLVDKISDAVDYSIIANAKLVKIEELNIERLGELVEKYNITELNTSVKPDVFKFLFAEHPGCKAIYLDPDIMVTGDFKDVLDALDTKNFVLTPHITSPVNDEFAPTDYHTLRTGIFNLGFIALKLNEEVSSFLSWWRNRVYDYGYCKLDENMFYDQLWTNYIPVFYDSYTILKHPGYNVANWNLHERYLSKNSFNKWTVNGRFALNFFHFSGYKFTNPRAIGSYHTRYDFINRPDLLGIFEIYQSRLISFGVEKLYYLPCYYYELHKSIKANVQHITQHIPLKVKVARRVARFLRKIIYE
ncbi:glycosyl transferase [Hymenobacter busanensis]|uniref:Glycosyl transferase n=1 Tax=Hymenobacter busanensis TaxID=2607656 RepID=A0A7L4ZX19_9BACT|nr:glycosyl transferase [Hymenobacter busanensis]KAA9332267.1 glycosyl transferase [Hymenobacter busanensis]QHJ07396.1 glycosyl transferase [Hymenobacter busanensis]